MSNFYLSSSGGSGGVTSLNTLEGALTLVAGANVTITPSGSTLIIAASGGGGGGSSGILGSVQFSGGSGAFSSDAANLFWDNSSKSLGVGTNTPNADSGRIAIKTGNSEYGFQHTTGTTIITSYIDTVGWIGTKSNSDFRIFTNDGGGVVDFTADGTVVRPTSHLTTALGGPDNKWTTVNTNEVSAGTGGSATALSLNGLSINVNSKQIKSLLDPTDPQDAATRAYVLANAGGSLAIRVITGNDTISATTDKKIVASQVSGGSFTITLPAGTEGLAFSLVRSTADTATWAITPNGGDILDGNIQSIFNTAAPTPITFTSGSWYAI